MGKPMTLLELRDAIAKAIADEVGHGMREKCERQADAVLKVVAPQLLATADAATMRQQAGRVDERLIGAGSMLSNFAFNIVQGIHLSADERWSLDETRKEWDAAKATLAQNTQGDGEAVAWMHTVTQGDGETDQALSFSRDSFPLDTQLGFRSLGAVPLYLHAERARVPKGMVLVPREPTPEMLAAVEGSTCSVRVAEDDSVEYPLSEDECAEIYRNMLSAAPSQRAEVK